jgi:hypothetical protein
MAVANSRIKRFAAVMILSVLAAGSIMVGLRHAWESSVDLLWQPIRILLSGHAPAHLYIEGRNGTGPQYSLLLEQVPNYPVWQVSAYPPSGLLFLWPLALLPWATAKLAWAASNLGFTFGILVMLRRLYLRTVGQSGIALIASLFIIGTPFRNTLGNGQYGLFVLFCFLVALDAERHERPKLAAFALAGSWLKCTVTFPLSIIFLYRGRIRVAVGAALVHVGLVLALALWTSSSPLSLLLEPLAMSQEFLHEGAIDVFSLSSELGPSGIAIMGLISATLLLLTAYVIVRYGREDELLAMSILSLLSCIALYHHYYDHIVLIFPLAYLVRELNGTSRSVRRGRLQLILFAVLVGVSWYAVRIADAATAFWPGVLSAYTKALVEGSLIVALYGAFGTGLVQLIKRGDSPPVIKQFNGR